jgi:hypothetical protein
MGLEGKRQRQKEIVEKEKVPPLGPVGPVRISSNENAMVNLAASIHYCEPCLPRIRGRGY